VKRPTITVAVGFLAVLALAAGLVAVEARAQTPQVEIRSQGVTDTRIPIAVPAFLAAPGLEGYGPSMAQILAADLDFTGLFRIVGSDRYPSGFRGLPPEASRIDFEGWRRTPAEMLIHGVLTNENGVLVAECRLFDVPEAQQVVGKRLRTEPRWSRLLAHQFADETVRFLTGVAGVASSEIAFSGGRKGVNVKEIFIADYDAGQVTQVTKHGSISIRPKFSPDGKQIAYLSYKDRYPWIYIYDRESGESRAVSKRVGVNHAPAWSPDGRRIAFVLSKDGNTEIYVKDVDGSEERRLTDDDGLDTSPVYSPDGRSIAFVSDRAGRPQVYVMNADGAQQRRISYQGGSSYDPAWSPNGRYIAYIVEKDGEGLELWVMNSDGTGARPLTASFGSNESPTWSPDSRHVAFSSSRSGIAQLYTVTLETGVVRQVPNLGELSCEGPSWGPRRQ